MHDIAAIVQALQQELETKSSVRDHTLGRARELTRLCANSIRATHRAESKQAEALLRDAKRLASEMREAVAEHQDLYFAGYTQDALKEFAEATITYAVVNDRPVPDPLSLGVEPPAYLNGLAEAMGELRRHVLDLIRKDLMQRAEHILAVMDEVYWLLVTVDFPDAVTGGLRRNTDMVRGVLERTRADLTTAQEQALLREALAQFEARLDARQ